MKRLGNLPVSVETENYIRHREQLEKYYSEQQAKQQQKTYEQLEEQLYKKLNQLLDTLFK